MQIIVLRTKNHLAESDFLFSACFSHFLSTTGNKGGLKGNKDLLFWGVFSLLARFPIAKIRNRLSCRGTKWNHFDGDIAAG